MLCKATARMSEPTAISWARFEKREASLSLLQTRRQGTKAQNRHRHHLIMLIRLPKPWPSLVVRVRSWSGGSTHTALHSPRMAAALIHTGSAGAMNSTPP